MSENILQTLQHLVQDVIAPDVRELKANHVATEKQIAPLERHMDLRFTAADQKNEARFSAVDARFAALDQKIDARFRCVDGGDQGIAGLAELTHTRLIAALTERVAVLESQRHQGCGWHPALWKPGQIPFGNDNKRG